MSPIARLTRFCIDHRRFVILGWIAVAVGALALSSAVGTRYANNFSLPGTDSQRAADLLKRDFPAQAGDSDQIVFAARRRARSATPAVRARITPMLGPGREAAARHRRGQPVRAAGGARGLARTGTIAFATVNFDQRANDLPKAAVKRVIVASPAAPARARLQVELGGQAIQQAQQPPLGTGAPAIGHRSRRSSCCCSPSARCVAMGLPIITALFGLGTGDRARSAWPRTSSTCPTSPPSWR